MNKFLFLKDPIFYCALIVAVTFIPSYTFGIGYLLYYPMILFAVYYLNKGFAKDNLVSFFGLFLLVCFISLLVNYLDILPVFNPLFRFFAFVLLIVAFTPILYSVRKMICCYNFVQYSCIILVIIGFVNFCLYQTGVVSYEGGMRVYAGTIGSNALGILCSLGIVYLFSLLMYYKQKRIRFFFVISFLLLGLILCLLLSSARNAIISVILSMIFMLYIKYRGKLRRVLFAISAFVFVIVLSFPLWRSYTLGISDKQGGNYEEFDMRSRRGYWHDRVAEFNSSPIIGIGFANISNPTPFSLKTGIVETTTGWGALFSQLGLLGAIPFILFTLKNFFYLLRHKRGGYIYCLLMGIFIFFCVNSIGEGYITTSGSPFTIYFWIVQGIIYCLRKKIIVERDLFNFIVKG